MPNQQGSGWRNWGDHPFVVIVGLLAAIIGIIVFITGANNLQSLLQSPTQQPTILSNSSSSFTPVATPITISTSEQQVSITDINTPTVTNTPSPPTPTLNPSPTRTTVPTETPIPAGAVLYEANWSEDIDKWVGTPDWKYVGGMIGNDGSNDGTGVILAPYEPEEYDINDYAVEAEIQHVRGGLQNDS